MNRLKGLCSLHQDGKPLICSLSPVGRMVDLERKTENFVYVKPDPDCPGVNSSKENRLVDLTDKFREELDFELRFYKVLKNIAARKPEKSEVIEAIYSFDTNQPFTKIIDAIEQSVNF